MYKSPIEIIFCEMSRKFEGDILKAIQKYDVVIDKEGLLRALRYDRGQYDKGYADGKADALKWIPVTEQEEPTENGTYLCHGYWFGSRRKQTETADFCGEWNIANNFILTHWMPLPQPPKVGEADA